MIMKPLIALLHRLWRRRRFAVGLLALPVLAACATNAPFRDETMDFGSVRTVAVLPLVNLTRDNVAAERVRDVFMTQLLATGGLYVVPIGEATRGIVAAGIANPTTPTPEEVVKLAKIINVDAVITGVVREYGEVRSGTNAANVASLSMQMMEAQLGKIVWSASTTRGGIKATDRLFGSGGAPISDITEEAVNDIINQLFQ